MAAKVGNANNIRLSPSPMSIGFMYALGRESLASAIRFHRHGITNETPTNRPKEEETKVGSIFRALKKCT